jgi:transposase
VTVRQGPKAHQAPDAAEIAKQQAGCYQLQLDGLSIREIAKRTGLSVGTVHRRINAQCVAIVQPLAEQVRARHLEQIKTWLARINAQIERDYAVARNVEVGTRLLEREAKLLGIDAPQQIEATVTEVTQEDVALAALIREAQAAAAVEEAALRDGQ